MWYPCANSLTPLASRPGGTRLHPSSRLRSVALRKGGSLQFCDCFEVTLKQGKEPAAAFVLRFGEDLDQLQGLQAAHQFSFRCWAVHLGNELLRPRGACFRKCVLCHWLPSICEI